MYENALRVMLAALKSRSNRAGQDDEEDDDLD